MITLEANYSKKIGLPGYSSHQFSVSLKSELSDVSQVEHFWEVDTFGGQWSWLTIRFVHELLL
jgi:hypothetical protein